MFSIYFYKRSDGAKPVRDYIDGLEKKADKDSRIKLRKIREYIKALRKYGLQLGEPHIKHIEGKIWELRPLRNRILFVAWQGDNFILLHHFVKKTQKTPRQEIEKARREIKEIVEGRGSYE